MRTLCWMSWLVAFVAESCRCAALEIGKTNSFCGPMHGSLERKLVIWWMICGAIVGESVGTSVWRHTSLSRGTTGISPQPELMPARHHFRRHCRNEQFEECAICGPWWMCRKTTTGSVKRTQRSPSGLPCSTPDKSCSPKTSSRSLHWLTCTYQVHTFRCWDRQMNLSSWRHSRSSRKHSVSWYRQGSIARLVWIAPLVASS
mmetsp:Transcript_155359/g.498446  ORF Transcript_155359/g.498446 Transcript_155359/m.498446 type:complete len:202 (-) Transcript_155359:2142-2747(-)